MIALIVLSAINALFSFLALACLGRIVRESNENVVAFIQAHNILVRRITDLDDSVDSALDCLLTVDAQASSSSSAESHE